MSWRVALAVVGTGVVGCAEAGPAQQGPADAPSARTDAAHPMIDGARPLDAASATCTTAATCQTATVMTGIGGDEDGASTSTISGYQSAWFSIRLAETDSGPLADPMSMQTTLTSPAGVMYDLLVFEPGDASSTECNTPTGTITTTGTSETSTLEWGETGTFANDADDSRTMTIEITPRSGDACAPDNTWSLSIVTGVD